MSCKNITKCVFLIVYHNLFVSSVTKILSAELRSQVQSWFCAEVTRGCHPVPWRTLAHLPSDCERSCLQSFLDDPAYIRIPRRLISVILMGSEHGAIMHSWQKALDAMQHRGPPLLQSACPCRLLRSCTLSTRRGPRYA